MPRNPGLLARCPVGALAHKRRRPIRASTVGVHRVPCAPGPAPTLGSCPTTIPTLKAEGAAPLSPERRRIFITAARPQNAPTGLRLSAQGWEARPNPRFLRNNHSDPEGVAENLLPGRRRRFHSDGLSSHTRPITVLQPRVFTFPGFLPVSSAGMPRGDERRFGWRQNSLPPKRVRHGQIVREDSGPSEADQWL